MNLPADFIAKYEQLLNEEAPAFFASFDNDTRHGFRVNPLKQTLTADMELKEPTEHCQFGYYGDVNGKSVAHQSGLIYSQEPSAMFVGEVAHPTPGDRVLDLCAAPGGKSTHLASFMANRGLLVANEIEAKRAKILDENLERFGAGNVLITNANPTTIANNFEAFFDKIVVDAPCSGEGMFRKNPEAMDYWNLNYPVECATRQKEILTEAVKTLKPGGELIYSTCTFAPEEDEQIISWLVTNYDFEILPINKFAGMDDGRPEWADGNADLKQCVRLFPHHFEGEGHFVAKLRKPVAEIVPAPTKSKKNKRQTNAHALMPLNREQNKLWQEFSNDFFTQSVFNNLRVFNDKLYSIPDDVPELTKIKIVRLGMHLGTFKKNRFEPSYSMALGVKPALVNRKLSIDLASWQKYVQGETFTIDSELPKGWYQLVCLDQPVGIGKLVGTTVKNFFPKGLRFHNL